MNILLSSLLAVGSQSAQIESPIVNNCIVAQRAFCILDAGMEVREVVRGGYTQITVYAGHSPEQAATVSFPQQCATSRAALPHLVGYSAYDPREGRIYLTLIFKINDRCSLTVSAPSFLDRESSLMGLSIVLGLVRICERRPCSGRSLIDAVPQRLRRSWFSRRP
jgi:hypothetical protein